MQVKQRQDLRDLRRAAHVRGQDRASKPPSLAGGLVHPFVIDPRGLHLDRASPAHDLATLGITVADGQSPPFFVAIGFGHFEVGLYLGLESGSEHLFGSLAGDLVEVEHDLPTSSFVVVYPVPRCTLPADAGTSALPFDCSKGRYTTSLTKSSIHNFRSYLANSKMPSVLLYTQAKMIDCDTIQTKKGAKGREAWGRPAIKNSGRCHMAHTTPMIRAELSPLRSVCSVGKAYPRQPISSPAASKSKNTTLGGKRKRDLGAKTGCRSPKESAQVSRNPRDGRRSKHNYQVPSHACVPSENGVKQPPNSTSSSPECHKRESRQRRPKEA